MKNDFLHMKQVLASVIADLKKDKVIDFKAIRQNYYLMADGDDDRYYTSPNKCISRPSKDGVVIPFKPKS